MHHHGPGSTLLAPFMRDQNNLSNSAGYNYKPDKSPPWLYRLLYLWGEWHGAVMLDGSSACLCMIDHMTSEQAAVNMR